MDYKSWSIDVLVLSTNMNYFSVEREIGQGKQRKLEAEMAYMFWFNKNMHPCTLNDRISMRRFKYQIPYEWEGNMQTAIRKGFDYDMMQKYIAFHRQQIYNIECEIALHPMTCKKQMDVPTEHDRRRLAFHTLNAVGLQTLYKHLEAHRRMVIKLNCNKQVLLISMQNESEIHRWHALYD